MRAAADDQDILSKLLRIQKMYVPTTAPVTALLTADAAADDEDLTFLKTGFTTNCWVLVGSGTKQQLVQLGTIPSGSEAIPIQVPAEFDWPIGTRVAKCVVVDLGYIEEGSATLSGSSSTPSVGAANAAGKIWQGDPDIGDLSVSWQQRASSLENILSAYGVDETLVKGDGTAGNPYRVMVHPDTMGSQRDYAYLLSALKKSGATQYFAFLNPTPTISANTALGAKGNPATWTVGCLYTHKQTWTIE